MKWRPAPSWNDDDLADDVATLSYESALKAHARYRPTDRSLTLPADVGPFCYEEAPTAQQPVVPYTESLGAIAQMEPAPAPDKEASLYWATAFERKLKDASITIRMSKAECEQLHRRAGDAGLTVSAYLRSCTFEAESLRTMVKETMAQLRLVTTQAKPADAAPTRLRRLTRWLRSLLTPWHGSQRIVRA
jgi:hypothetical protein